MRSVPFRRALAVSEKTTNLPAVAIFDTCAITKLEDNRYQLDVSYKFPANMQSEDFYISLIRFPGWNPGDRYAVPNTTSFVHVVSDKAQPAATISAMTIKNLKPVTSIKNVQVTNSYQIEGGQTFQVELLIKGDQELSDFQVELPMWTPHPRGIAHIFYNGPVVQYPALFGKVSVEKFAGGSKVTLEVKMAPMVEGYPVMAMKFARIYMRTSDFSWVEIENRNDLDGLIANSKYAE